jgi:hypothetical protein
MNRLKILLLGTAIASLLNGCLFSESADGTKSNSTDMSSLKYQEWLQNTYANSKANSIEVLDCQTMQVTPEEGQEDAHNYVGENYSSRQSFETCLAENNFPTATLDFGIPF